MFQSYHTASSFQGKGAITRRQSMSLAGNLSHWVDVPIIIVYAIVCSELCDLIIEQTIQVSILFRLFPHCRLSRPPPASYSNFLTPPHWEAIDVTSPWLITPFNSSLIIRVKSAQQEKSTAPSLIFFILKSVSEDNFFSGFNHEADLHWSIFTFGWSDVVSCAVQLSVQRANTSHLAWDWDGVVFRLIH